MRLLRRLTPHLFLAAVALAILLPLVFMVVTSVKTDEEYAGNKLGIPNDVTFDNLVEVIQDPNLLTWAGNSAIVTAASVAIAVVAALLAAYGLARSGASSVRRMLVPVIALIAVPPVILVVPLFSLFADAGLVNRLEGVILIYAGLLTPLAVYLFSNYFETIPVELDDAAVIDGASRFQILRHVFLPLARPAILTVSVVGAAFVWNEFLIALLFLQSEGSQTLIVGLTSFQGRYDADEPLLMAWSLMATLPILALYVFGQRYLVRGLTGGAVK